MNAAATSDDASARPSRGSGIVPALRWLRSYKPAWFRADLVAGITLAAYLLPAGLGDASLANLPPEAGLYACLFGGLVFWLFCSSRHTTITVTSAISLLVGASLGGIAGGDTSRFSALAAGTAVLVACIAFTAWLVKAGSIVNFISESVMVGFKCGVALFLASTQLPKLFGIHGAHGNFWKNSGNFLTHLYDTNLTSLTIGGVALVALVLGKIFLKNKPVALFIVVGGILASGWLGLEARGVKLLGEVPQGLPAFGLQRFTGRIGTNCCRWRSPVFCWARWRRPRSVACLRPNMAAGLMRTRNSSRSPHRISPSVSAAGFQSVAACHNRSLTKARVRARHCQAPSPQGLFLWWCFSSRTCWLRCLNRSWPRSSWWRWPACSRSPPSNISGAAIALNSSSPSRPSSGCSGRDCCAA